MSSRLAPCAGNNHSPSSAVSSVCYAQWKPRQNQQASEDIDALENCSLQSNTLQFYGPLLIPYFYPL